MPDPNTPTSYFLKQWRNPSDIFSILLLLSPEIVQRSIAQLTGRSITPVAFSFGWVAYAVNTLLAIVSDGKLMPEADVPDTLVVDAQTGHIRTTKNWVLARLLRDMNLKLDEDMRNEGDHVAPGEVPKQGSGMRPWEALRVSVFEVIDSTKYPHGVPIRDWIWFSGFVVIGVEIIISSIPWIIDGQWGTFLIVVSGNILALVGASLPQWAEEKWDAPKRGSSTVTLTYGNGSRHAITILGSSRIGLDLNILARGTRTTRESTIKKAVTGASVGVLALLWILLLLTAAGLTINSWYLICIGTLGNIQNIIAAGKVRSPSAFGLHIRPRESISGASVASVLKDVESRYPLLGTSLVPVFFPGSMRVQEVECEFWREAMDRRMAPNHHGIRIDTLGRSTGDISTTISESS